MEELDIQDYFDLIFTPYYNEHGIIWDFFRCNFYNGQHNFFKYDIKYLLEEI